MEIERERQSTKYCEIEKEMKIKWKQKENAKVQNTARLRKRWRIKWKQKEARWSQFWLNSQPLK